MVSMRGTRQPGNHLAAIQKQTMANTALQPFKTKWETRLRIRSLFNSVGLAAMDGYVAPNDPTAIVFCHCALSNIDHHLAITQKRFDRERERESLQGNRLLKTHWHEGVKKKRNTACMNSTVSERKRERDSCWM